jgi:hypothetical protein
MHCRIVRGAGWNSRPVALQRAVLTTFVAAIGALFAELVCSQPPRA